MSSKSSYFTWLAKQSNHVVLDVMALPNANKVDAYLATQLTPQYGVNWPIWTYLPDVGMPVTPNVYGVWKTLTQSETHFDLGTIGPSDPSTMPSWGAFDIQGYSSPNDSPYGFNEQGYVITSIPCVVSWGFSNI